MAFIPVPATARISIGLTAGTDQYYITLHFEASVNFDEVALAALIDAVIDWATTRLMPTLSSDLALNEVNGLALHSSSAPSLSTVVSPQVAGGVAGNPLPANAPMVVTHRTPLRGRSYRGRNYVPGIPEGDVTSSGLVSVAREAAILTAFLNLTDVEVAEGVTHVVVSYRENNVVRPTGVTTPVTAYTSDGIIRNQRRRQFGVGS